LNDGRFCPLKRYPSEKMFTCGFLCKIRLSPMSASPLEITRLLSAWSGGDRTALDALAPLVYDELRRIAASQMRRERDAHTLQPTALVNEAFLRMSGSGDGTWESRRHFYAVAATVMRHVLTDHARAANRDKRGGGAVHVALHEDQAATGQPDVDLIALDRALTQLERMDPQKARIVELRHFTGLGIDETAELLGISAMTVRREWERARLWLLRMLREGAA
jgi:RNA polymerase sigma factor (TIGR02999 family)